MSLPTPDEFKKLSFDEQRDDAYTELHQAYTAALKRIREQDLIIRGAAKTMVRLHDMCETLDGGDA